MTFTPFNERKAKPKGNKFVETVRMMRRQQDILERWGDPVSVSVFEKIEDIMQGTRGIKFTPHERGKQEAAYLKAKHELAIEDARIDWERYESCAHVSAVYLNEFDKKSLASPQQHI